MPNGSRYNGKSSYINNSDRLLAHTIDDIEKDVSFLKDELQGIFDEMNIDKIQSFKDTITYISKMQKNYFNRENIDATSLGITKTYIEEVIGDMKILGLPLSDTIIEKLIELLKEDLLIGFILINYTNLSISKPLELFALIHILREKIGEL